MQKENRNVQNNDALKGFLFRAYNARCYKNVGQVLPDKKQNLIKNNSCVVGPEQKLLRTSALLNRAPSSALTGHLPPHGEAAHFNAPSTWRERVKARMRGCSLFNLINPSPALRASSPARGEEDVVRGFTLIELLVVILIIGILAAVAVPQYQKAVIKARFAEAKIHIHTLNQAMETCVLERGRDECTSDNLNVSVGTTVSNIANMDFLTNSFGYLVFPGGVDASYLKDNVCICYRKDGNGQESWNLSTEDNNLCYPYWEKGPNFEYDKILGIEYDENCVCC